MENQQAKVEKAMAIKLTVFRWVFCFVFLNRSDKSSRETKQQQQQNN